MLFSSVFLFPSHDRLASVSRMSVKFKTVTDIRDTLSRSDFKSKPHARQSQIINLIHQRVRAAYRNAKNPETKKRLKKAYDYATKRKEASKEKTKRMKKK